MAAASAAPETFGDQAAGPTRLILRMADGTHVVYRWGEGRLERSAAAGDARSLRALPLGGDGAAVEFDRSEKGRMVILRLIERPRREGDKRVIEYSATLGGDYR